MIHWYLPQHPSRLIPIHFNKSSTLANHPTNVHQFLSHQQSTSHTCSLLNHSQFLPFSIFKSSTFLRSHFLCQGPESLECTLKVVFSWANTYGNCFQLFEQPHSTSFLLYLYTLLIEGNF